MNDTKKKELFPYFAYAYSKEHQPAKYGERMKFEEWHNLIQEDVPFLEEISNAAINLGDDAWNKLEKDYSNENQVESAKKGAKLDNLKRLNATKKKTTKKKGGKVSSCSCGCDLIAAKVDGGAIGRGKGFGSKSPKKCSCGCS